MKNATELIDILLKGMDQVSKTEDRKEINQIVEGFLSDILGSEYISFFLLDEQSNSLYMPSDETQTTLSIGNMTGLLGNTLLSKTPAFYNHVKSEKFFKAETDNPDDLKIKSQLIFPLMENDTIIGALRASRNIKQSQSFTNYDIEILKSIQPYLIKLVHIFLNDARKEISIDRTSVNSQLKDVTEHINNDNKDINDTMMFLANTVHDIRTPANSLYGFLELMEEQIDNQKLLDLISGAKESASFINMLTDSILDRVKHENEVQNAKPEKVNTLKYFSSIANIFTANMTDKNIHYVVSIDTITPKEISLDAIKLKRVLINLIGNAYKFTPSGKMIRFKISYDAAKGRVYFEVEDEGLGIPKDRQQEIFKAFEQAQADTSIHFGGTGLGLAISSKYVQEMGGTLELKSEVDMGSTFYFDIPVEVVDATPIYIRFHDLKKKIVIYTNDIFCIDANNIKRFLTEAGMPEENILIGEKIPKDTTHLICFEHKFNDNVVSVCTEHKIKLIVFEEKMFSVSKQEKYKDIKTISKNTCYGSVIYSAVSSRKKPKVLIVDDNKVNVKLLEMILEGVYCDVSYELNAEDGIETLTQALEKEQPFDVLFLDKNMPGMSGTELLRQYREAESKHPYLKSTYAVSITGDITTTKEETQLFDQFVKKPFKNSAIKEIFKTFEI